MTISKKRILTLTLSVAKCCVDAAPRGNNSVFQESLPEDHVVTSLRGIGKTRHPKKSSKSRKGSLNNIFGLENKSVLSTEDEFLEYCQHELLSDSAVSDGLVSQNDATDFISAVCGIADSEDVPAFHCPSPTFSNLDTDVQLAVAHFICPHDDHERLAHCLENLREDGADFGYPIILGTTETTRQHVLGLCCALLPFLRIPSMDELVGTFNAEFGSSSLPRNRDLTHSTTSFTDASVCSFDLLSTAVPSSSTINPESDTNETMATLAPSLPPQTPLQVGVAQKDAPDAPQELNALPKETFERNTFDGHKSTTEAVTVSLISSFVTLFVFTSFYGIVWRRRKLLQS